MTLRRELTEEPWRFDLFTALRLVERAATDRPRIGESSRSSEEAVRIGQDPFLEFPAATIDSASTDPDGLLHLRVRFLGLFGPQGALPIATTEEAYGWVLARDPAFPKFADIVQGRFLQLFFRAWAQARPVVQADRPDRDRFVGWIGSIAGIASAPVRDAGTLPLGAKLDHAGLLAFQVRSASRLESFLTSLFDVPVEVEEFVGSWLELDQAEQTRLGTRLSGLGVDTFLGAGAFSVSDKYRIRVQVSDLETYRSFLPDGRQAEQLTDAVVLMMGAELEWDVELAIPARAIEPTRLGVSGRLGWTSWVIDRQTDPGDAIRRDARFQIADRRNKSVQLAS